MVAVRKHLRCHAGMLPGQDTTHIVRDPPVIYSGRTGNPRDPVLEVNDAQYGVVCYPAAALSHRSLRRPRRPRHRPWRCYRCASLPASFTPTPPLRMSLARGNGRGWQSRVRDHGQNQVGASSPKARQNGRWRCHRLAPPTLPLRFRPCHPPGSALERDWFVGWPYVATVRQAFRVGL